MYDIKIYTGMLIISYFIFIMIDVKIYVLMRDGPFNLRKEGGLWFFSKNIF